LAYLLPSLGDMAISCTYVEAYVLLISIITNFFILIVHENKLKSMEIILSELNNITIKSYLLFLKYLKVFLIIFFSITQNFST